MLLGFLSSGYKRKAEPEPNPPHPTSKAPIERALDNTPSGSTYPALRPRKRVRCAPETSKYCTQGTGKNPINLTDESPPPSYITNNASANGGAGSNIRSGGSHVPCTGSTATRGETTAKSVAPAPIIYEHDPKYFFEDGDIIFRIQATLFRVHRKLMVSVKGIFEDMLLLPQPDDAENLGGVAICEMHLLSHRDMRFLLGFIYGDIKLRERTVGALDVLYWDATMALLSVSRKIDLPGVRRSAIEALTALFPCDPTNYHPSQPVIRGVSKADRPRFLRYFALEAINAFTECNLPSLLPMAYYHAAQLPVEDIVTGVQRNEASRETLHPSDIIKVLEGKEKLRVSRRSTVFGWLDNLTPDGRAQRPTTGCDNVPLTGDDTCFYFLLRMSLDFNRNGFLDTKTAAMKPLSRASLNLIKSHLCDDCWTDVQERLKKGLDDNWAKLPSYFRLGSWDEIMTAQAREDSHWDDL